MRGQRPHQARQLVVLQITAAAMLDVALDADARIVVSHVPADGEREHLRQNGDNAIGAVRMSSFGNSLVQAIDILEGDVRYLQMLERWADMIVEHAPVICGAEHIRTKCSVSKRSIRSAMARAARSAAMSASGSPPSSISRRSRFASARAAVVDQSGYRPIVCR